MIGSGDEGKAVHVVYLDFCKAFDTVPHGTFVARLGIYRLNGWTTRSPTYKVGEKLIGPSGSRSNGQQFELLMSGLF